MTEIRSARTYIYIFHTRGYGNVHELNANNIKRKEAKQAYKPLFNVPVGARSNPVDV
jgi:hypothetical protein